MEPLLSWWTPVCAITLSAFAFAPAEPEYDRVYLRVATPQAAARVAPFVVHRYPGDVVCAALPSGTLETLGDSGLIYLGDDPTYVVEPVWPGDSAPGTPPGPSEYLQRTHTRACLPGDQGWPVLGYGVRHVYGDPALAQPSGGEGVRVAILDTGVSLHPDLVQRIVFCRDVPLGDSLNGCFDTAAFTAGHGTAVATVIAADAGADGLGLYGVAPGAQLYVYKVCRGNLCSESDIIAGLYDAVARGVNIVNISLASGFMSTTMRDALDFAVANNVLVIAAAGNAGPFPNTIAHPAAYHKVVAVGAIQENFAVWNPSSRGRNDGDYIKEDREIEFGAPGHQIVMGSRRGCYAIGDGTSFAAPHVTGLAAKLWNGNAAETRLLLQESARHIDLHTPGDDNATGFGLPTALHANRPPDCSGAVASVPGLWPPNHRFVPVHVEGVVDPDGDAVSMTIDAVRQDEAGGANPAHCPDAVIDGAEVRLRAERDGGGDGRVYAIDFTASDGKGGTCHGTVRVCVPHDAGGAACVEGLDGGDATVCPSPARGRSDAAGVSEVEGVVVRHGAAPSRPVLEYSLPRAADVAITLHDLAGRRVATVLRERQAAGSHAVALDLDGASGVYFVRAVVGDRTWTRAVVRMR